MSLTAPERETVVTLCDADDHMNIWTAQRPIITKLKANPAAELVREGRIGMSVWAEFRMPAGLLSFRSGKRRMTDAQREQAAERMRQMHTRSSP